jgi:hypothetical protein
MVAACVAAAALGAESGTVEDGYARRGWLVSAGGSYAMETFGDEVESDLRSEGGSTESYSVDDSFGVNGRVGYQCHPRFSVEEEVEWIHGFEADISDSTLSDYTVDAEAWVFTTNTKGYLLTGRYQPFVLLGAGVLRSDFEKRYAARSRGLGPPSGTNVDFVLRFGAGIDLYATKHVVVSAEVDYVLPFYVGDLENLDYLSFSLGLQYRF